MKVNLTNGRSQWLLDRLYPVKAIPKSGVNLSLFLLLVSSLLFLNSNQLQGQSIARQVIGITGGSTATSFGSVSWTVGQTAVKHVKSNDRKYSVTQGFQQPNLSILPSTVDPLFSINIFPNPTQDLIQVTLWDASRKDLIMNLNNTKGQTLIANQAINPWKNEIDLSRFPAGTYFLRVSNQEEQSQTYKVIKTK